jgi:hypothetical protein
MIYEMIPDGIIYKKNRSNNETVFRLLTKIQYFDFQILYYLAVESTTTGAIVLSIGATVESGASSADGAGVCIIVESVVVVVVSAALLHATKAAEIASTKNNFFIFCV